MVEFKEFNDISNVPEEEFDDISVRPVLEDTRSHRKYTIPTYPMFIGREKKGSVCIPIGAVSRRHAKVFEKSGVFYVQDAGSINGTYVNDKRIIDPVEIKEGDRIKVAITKEYPHGVREFVFKYDVSLEELEAKKRDKERDQVLELVGIAPSTAPSGGPKKIAAHHCTFHVNKKDLVSVLTSEQPRRIPLENIDIEKGTFDFLSLYPYRVKDTLMLTIKHGRLPSAIRLVLKVSAVSEHPHHNILLHQTTIAKIGDDEKKLLDLLDLSTHICYVTCKIKENTVDI